MAKGVMHYTKSGKKHTGPTHKMGKELHTGASHTKLSKPLFHYAQLSEAAKRRAKK